VPPAPKAKLPEPTRTEAPPAPRPRIAAPEPRTPPADTSTTRTGRQPQLDLIALLEAAGVPPGAATPGVARELGEILRIVVAGVMDVLAARDKIKEEFRIRQTTFKSTDNNPLKFSANAEDALYNLLVKRNPAYLGPVDAFEDGFADLRNHQLAMLAGMRVAYEAMLRRFDPERLRERFDEKGTRGALLPMPGRMRYWEQFGEHYRDMVKDPEASFRELFGAEFTRAYEEQMLRLRTLGRSQKRGS
jgi:type VI secretion system FHA domain protein